MIKCPNCNKELEDGSRFCDECGTSIPESVAQAQQVVQEQQTQTQQVVQEQQVQTQQTQSVFCPKCGKQLPAGSLFCDGCGAQLGAASGANIPVYNTANSQPNGKKKKSPALVLGIIAACVVVVLLIAGVSIFALSSKDKSSETKVDYAMYVKEKELFYSNLKQKTPTQITEDLAEDSDISNSDLRSLDGWVVRSDDGNYLFYPREFEADAEDITLYYSKISKKDSEAEKIDSGVSSYYVNDNATYVTYLKGGDTLYSYNLKKADKEKIAGDVKYYLASDDGKQAYYVNDEGTLYLWTMGKEKEKIDSDIYSVEYISDDWQTVYYIKDDNLYKRELGKEREKIASDVDSVLEVYDSGCVYYSKESETEFSMGMFVSDDMKEEDANMKEPEYPNYYSYEDRAKYDAAMEEYNKALEKYNAKRIRDSMREQLSEQLKEDAPGASFSALYFYDGQKETEICDGFLDMYECASESEKVLFPMIDLENMEKVKLSKIVEDNLSFEEIAEKAAENAISICLARKDEVETLEAITEGENIQRIELDSDGKRIMYLADYDSEKAEGDLYMMTEKNNEFSDAELIASDVCVDGYYFVGDSYSYYTDVKDGEGDFYIDGEFVASDVQTESEEYYFGVYYYYTDYDSEKYRGTLNCYDNGKSEVVADDVYNYYVIGNKKALILNNYNTDKYKGDLYLYSGNKLKALDDDVVWILTADSAKRKSIYYYHGSRD